MVCAGTACLLLWNDFISLTCSKKNPLNKTKQSVEKIAVIEKLEPEDKRDWLIICMYLVRNCPRKSLLR